MKGIEERFITLDDFVYWVEVERFIYNKPTYKIVRGYYLGSYTIGSYIKHICTEGVTSCVVKHIDPQYVFTDEAAAIKTVDALNKNSKEV